MSTVRLDEVLIANRLIYYYVLIIHHLVHCHWLLQLLELVSPSLGESSAADVLVEREREREREYREEGG